MITVIIRRVLGLLIVVIALSAVLFSVLGSRAGLKALDSIGIAVEESLTLVDASLDTVLNTIALTKQSVADVGTSVDTIQVTLNNLSVTVADTEPLLEEIGQVAGEDVPQSLEAIQATLPDIVQVASTIDNTLTTLNDFEIDQTIPLINVRLRYDLGINYSPAVPFDTSIERIGGSLDGVPDRLRNINRQLEISTGNLITVSDNLSEIAADLEATKQNVDAVQPLLDEYTALVWDIQGSLSRFRARASGQLEQLNVGLKILFLWLGLTQLAPIYVGISLLLGERAQPEMPDVSLMLDDGGEIAVQDVPPETDEDKLLSTNDTDEPESLISADEAAVQEVEQD